MYQIGPKEMSNNRFIIQKSTLILTVDVIAFTAFLFLVSTGLLIHYMLIPGIGRWSLVWGMNRHEWGDVHFRIALAFFAILTLHLFHHWRVITKLFTGHMESINRLRLSLAIVALLVLLGVALSPLLSPIDTRRDQRDQSGRQFRRGIERQTHPYPNAKPRQFMAHYQASSAVLGFSHNTRYSERLSYVS